MDFTGVMNDALLTVAGARIKSRGRALMDEETFRAFYDRTSRAVWSTWRASPATVIWPTTAAGDVLPFLQSGRAHHDEGHRRNSLSCIATNIAATPTAATPPSSRASRGQRGDEETVAIDTRIAERFEESTISGGPWSIETVQREMLWLAYALGSTHAEIAEIVGVKSAA